VTGKPIFTVLLGGKGQKGKADEHSRPDAQWGVTCRWSLEGGAGGLALGCFMVLKTDVSLWRFELFFR